VRAVVGKLPPQVVAVDGKTLRGSADRCRGQAALHLVSAWATASGWVLGQEATDAKSNEITAIPHLLRLLALEGCVVTIDAMGCQRAIAVQEQGADYVLALKGNQPTLQQTVVAAFAEAQAPPPGPWHPAVQETTGSVRRFAGIGREKTRACPSRTLSAHHKNPRRRGR
jgi:predicted transposase YbfD/YdcC